MAIAHLLPKQRRAFGFASLPGALTYQNGRHPGVFLEVVQQRLIISVPLDFTFLGYHPIPSETPGDKVSPHEQQRRYTLEYSNCHFEDQ